MKITIILSIILTIIIYGLLCYYIGRNGWTLIKITTLAKYKKSYISLIVFLSLSIFFEIMLPLVNTEKPDIVLLPGDIINDNIEPYLKQNMGEVLQK